ncbi:band 3 anion transport protein-like isoform X2 [Pollicipes pollicipes]|uniref:band 3 anion transport protein-like isoform X2 n=1 Tax=Pollicipes pollicipes TaxID=41117 RepID=UPI001884907D|nr:band 3 anion transport protein-like isoform X2 [Pollicipes pollicipes]
MASRRQHARRGSAPEETYLTRFNRAARARRLEAVIPEHEGESLLGPSLSRPVGILTRVGSGPSLASTPTPTLSLAPDPTPAPVPEQPPRQRTTRSNSQPYHRYAADNDAMDEMENMFRAPEERTDFASLVTEETEVKPAKRFSEDDFQGHFRENQYAKPHEPLKPVATKKKKKKSEDESGKKEEPSRAGQPSIPEDGDEPDEDEDEPSAEAPGQPRQVPTLVVTDEAPQVDGRGAYAPDADDKDSRVQFEVGQDPGEEEEEAGAATASPGHRERKHRRHRHVEDPAGRRVPGSERRPRRTSTGHGPLDDEDASGHLDDISSHRFEEAGHRRHKVKKKEDRNIMNVVHLGDINTGQTLLLGKKEFDHTPHDMYVQMDELTATENESEWQETARWIKYEEDVEPGADRWGKPHLTSLSFQSLMNLRRCLEKGTILLDVEEHDSVAISHRITTQLVSDDHIKQQDFGAVMRTLLLRRQNVADHTARGLRNYMSNRNLSRITLQSLADMRNNSSARSLSDAGKDKSRKNSLSVMSSSHGQIPRHNSFKSPQEIGGESITSNEDLRRFMAHHNILRRLAPGTEAFSVNVGRVDFAEGPVAAFVRLAEGTYLPGITEMPLPVRFIFFLVGPHDAFEDYNETGRAFATLMSSPAFHEAAYKAEGRNDLMWAFKEFLDDTLVLPPIDWTANPDVLDVHELQLRSREIQERKREKLALLERRREGSTSGAWGASGPAGDGGAAGDGGPPPPGDKEKLELVDDPLVRQGRPFAGFIRDIKRRYPFYLSDFKDGLSGAVLSAAFFIFFAALAGAITFGGLMMDKTELQIGISETLISTSIAGIVFALLSCQPLIIIGTTGPVLLFDEALFQFAESNGLEFLPMRVWIAIWMLVISLILVGLEGSVLVKKFTRFTTEIFSSLISILFIFESLAKLATVFINHPLLANYCADPLFLRSLSLIVPGLESTEPENGTTQLNSSAPLDGSERTEWSNGSAPLLDAPLTAPKNQPNTALLSLLLMFGTFAIAQYLRFFRNSKFLGRRVRRMLGDFGVPIAILLMVGADMLIPQVFTQRLEVPSGLTPSDPDLRGWFISPLGLRQGTSWVAIVGALPAAGLIFIVIYMETMVCELIMAKPERNLQKGTGFHVDIVLISLINLMSALIGAPWMCAATIRSVSHAAALTVMSSTYAPGEKPKMIGVYEQRLSALLVSILLGLSVALSAVLGMIPVAVVFGVFMYMGVSSMSGVQMLERCVLFLKPVKHHPDENYVKRVRTWRMHLFTVIQLACLGGLLGIKFTPAAIGFPFFLALLIPLRLVVLPRLFTPVELCALDGDGEMEPAEDADFYEEAHTMPAAASAPNFYNNSSLQLLRVPSSLNPKV